MKSCKSCGAQISDSVRFCTKCGANCENATPSRGPGLRTGAAERKPLPASSESRRHKSLAIPLAGIAGGIILVAAAMGVFLFKNENGADLRCAEHPVDSGMYDFTLLKGDVQIAELTLDGDSVQSHYELERKEIKPYLGKKLVFEGGMRCLVGVRGKQPGSRIINVASLDYDPERKDNPPLAPLGVVALDESGFVKSAKAKSGWIRRSALLTFDDARGTRTVLLEDVSFWVNRGGENWLAFSVGKASEGGSPVPVAVIVDRKGSNGRVTVWVQGDHAFHPRITGETSLEFIPAVDSPPAPPPSAYTRASIAADAPPSPPRQEVQDPVSGDTAGKSTPTPPLAPVPAKPQIFDGQPVRLGDFILNVPDDWTAFPGEEGQARESAFQEQARKLYQRYHDAPFPALGVELAAFRSGAGGVFQAVKMSFPPQIELMTALKQDAPAKAKWGIEQGLIKRASEVHSADRDGFEGFTMELEGSDGSSIRIGGMMHPSHEGDVIQLQFTAAKGGEAAAETFGKVFASVRLADASDPIPQPVTTNRDPIAPSAGSNAPQGESKPAPSISSPSTPKVISVAAANPEKVHLTVQLSGNNAIVFWEPVGWKRGSGETLDNMQFHIVSAGKDESEPMPKTMQILLPGLKKGTYTVHVTELNVSDLLPGETLQPGAGPGTVGVALLSEPISNKVTFTIE